MSITREALREAVARALYEFEPCWNVEGIIAWCDLDAWDEDGATREEFKVVADAVIAAIIPACQDAAMPPPLSDPATPDHMASTLYQAGRIDAANALAAFLSEK